MAPELADGGWTKVASELVALMPEEDEAILRKAGSSDFPMFYMAFASKRLVAHVIGQTAVLGGRSIGQK